MLLNHDHTVFVGQRLDTQGEAWQMPQGGIDEDEEPRDAAFRELREEIGTDKAEFSQKAKLGCAMICHPTYESAGITGGGGNSKNGS